MVVGFQSLVELALRRPSSLQELEQVSGFSMFKAKRYGQDFLAAVRSLPSDQRQKKSSASENAAQVQQQRQRGGDGEPQHKQARASGRAPAAAAAAAGHSSSSTDTVPSLKRALSDSILETLKAWQAHGNLRSVAQARGLRPKVVKQQLQQCERSGIASFTDPTDRKKLGMLPLSPPIAQSVQQHSTTAVIRSSPAESDSSATPRLNSASAVVGKTPTATAAANDDKDDEFSDVDIDFDEDF